MAVVNFNRSIPQLLTDTIDNFTLLVRKETQLARVEMSEKIFDLAIGIGLLVGGSVLLIPALVILLQAAVAGLVAAGIGSAWSSLIVGGIALLIGLVLLWLGIARLKAARPVPTKTIEQLQRDVEVAKAQMRNDNDATERAA
jgi:Putative Actinobacterial Holin-X, holin superfamily III